ncbi:MAG: hypothetical protein DMF87_22860 [Acidobacteria bacterium]|nr:MAG: hypothetical protein DMF87_22860 [Acidobacteriota bacterium]
MNRRFLVLIGTVVVVVAALIALPRLRPGEASQAQTTPWGEPDIQGIWTSDSETPLQRPAKYANREFFTDEERAELDKERATAIGREADESRRNRGTEQDVGGAYNAAVFTTHKRMGRRTSLIVDPPDGRIPALTPEAQKKRAAMREFFLALIQATDLCKNKLPGCEGGKYGPPSPRRNEVAPYYVTVGAAGGGGAGGGAINRADGPEDRGLGERCMAAALPDFGGNTGFYLQIVQSPERVAIFYDTGQGQGWQRIIPVTSNPHLPSQVRQWWGDSRGRWEGRTLVVDVTNFSPKSYFQGSQENLHLVERWTRLDANTIEYAVTIEDPSTWTRPWTVKQDYSKQSDATNRIYKEPRCHEGNYGMVALLEGARIEERAFAEKRGPDPATQCTAGCGGFALGFADTGEDSNPLAR